MKDIMIGTYSRNGKDKKARMCTKQDTSVCFFILMHTQVTPNQAAELQRSTCILQQMKLSGHFFVLKPFLTNQDFYPHGCW